MSDKKQGDHPGYGLSRQTWTRPKSEPFSFAGIIPEAAISERGYPTLEELRVSQETEGLLERAAAREVEAAEEERFDTLINKIRSPGGADCADLARQVQTSLETHPERAQKPFVMQSVIKFAQHHFEPEVENLLETVTEGNEKAQKHSLETGLTHPMFLNSFPEDAEVREHIAGRLTKTIGAIPDIKTDADVIRKTINIASHNLVEPAVHDLLTTVIENNPAGQRAWVKTLLPHLAVEQQPNAFSEARSVMSGDLVQIFESNIELRRDPQLFKPVIEAATPNPENFAETGFHDAAIAPVLRAVLEDNKDAKERWVNAVMEHPIMSSTDPTLKTARAELAQEAMVLIEERPSLAREESMFGAGIVVKSNISRAITFNSNEPALQALEQKIEASMTSNIVAPRLPPSKVIVSPPSFFQRTFGKGAGA